MPKHGFLTPKAIGNRIKSKGLQKLRWYCQMCQKQCRDENGFKCHTMSEAHQRQLLLVGENPDSFVDNFSQEFRAGVISLLKRQYNGRRIAATVVYNEYIQDKEHVHMNSTKWVTLTAFIHSLAEDGVVKLEETPKGWYMTYLEHDPEELEHKKMLLRRARHERNEEQRQADAIQAQIERDRAAAVARGETFEETVSTELRRDDDAEKVVVSLKTSAAARKPDPEPQAETTNVFKKLKQSSSTAPSKSKGPRPGDKRPLSNMERLKEELEAKKQKAAAAVAESSRRTETATKSIRKDYWLYEGIVVKVVNKTLKDGKFYKRKGVVQELVDKYTGKVRLLDAKTVLKLDQEFLETVIPKVGGEVLIVNGPHRGHKAVLLGLDIDHFSARVAIAKGPNKGLELPAIAYEDICKIHVPQ